MKRLLTLALLATAFVAGTARADFDPFWSSRLDAVQSVQSDSNLQPARGDIHTDYNP